MEMDSCCLHLNCVKIDRNFIKSKKLELSSQSSLATSPTTSRNNWRCHECNLNKDNWICLYCGIVSCGRYENGHALKHSGHDQNHCLCINTNILSVYCYICDEFVMNDTLDNVLEELRQELKDDVISDGISETSSTLEEVSSSKSTTIGSTTSSSSDSGWEEPPLIGRKLRPRKRTISSDNTSDNTPAQSPQQKAAQATPPSKRNKLKKVVGLRNLGNTCFMNSVLQSLSNIREFSCYFNKLPSLETTKLQQKQKTYHSRSMKENLDDVFVVEELRKVLLNLSQGGDGTKGAISPECLFLVIWRVVPQFRGHRQHDAHEFLRYMLDRLHTELQQVSYLPTDLNAATLPGSPASATATAKAAGTTASSTGTTTTTSSIFNLSPSISHLNKTQRNSIVTNVFGGTLQSEVRCLVCGMESKKHDPFLDLSLDIPEKFYKDGAGEEGGANNKGSGGATTTGCDNSKPKKPTCHISDCLSSFTEVEELAETELYYCNSCKCKQKSTKRFWVRRLPNVLCLHIKRFRWNNFFRTKIDLKITFPINSLDMSQFVLNNGIETRRTSSSSNVYDLAAVIVHHGNGSSCGHYTSFAINNGVWMHFNDHTVKEVSPDAVADCKPYILFYIKRELNKAS